MERGLIHLYCGEGKGKTTAAVGLCVRAVGQGMKVIFAQFFKSSPTGELEPLRALGVQVLRGELPKGFTWQLTDTQRAQLREGHDHLFREACVLAQKESCDLLVLDECASAAAMGYMDSAALLRFLKEKPEGLEVVLTGRTAPEELVAVCDYLTRMQAEKHPYEQGIGARRGIEY